MGPPPPCRSAPSGAWEKTEMICAVHEHPAFAEVLIAHLLSRNIRIEKRQARVLHERHKDALPRSRYNLGLDTARLSAEPCEADRQQRMPDNSFDVVSKIEMPEVHN